jgi:hypothetical protein
MSRNVQISIAAVAVIVTLVAFILAWVNGSTGQAIAYLGVMAAVGYGAFGSLRGTRD